MDLILHIGTEKTGTTLLQHWLHDNRRQLSDQGVFLSECIGKPANRRLVLFFQNEIGHFARLNGFRNLEERDSRFPAFARRFADEIAQAGKAHHTAIITSEHLHSRLQSLDEIKRLEAFLSRMFGRIRILCYFREQAAVRLSLYSTGLKRELDTRVEDFQRRADQDEYFYNYYRIAAQWARVFGADAVDYRIYDKIVALGDDIRRDFLTVFFRPVDAAALSFDRKTANKSLGFLKARAYRVINQKLPFWTAPGETNRVNIAMKKAVDSCGKLDTGRIEDKGREEFSRRFDESNRRFFREFIADVEDERYFHRAGDGDGEPQARFTLAEVGGMIEELTGALAGTVARLLDRQLRDGDAKVLRNIAIKVAKGERLDEEAALALMELAARARPGGPVIRKMIEEWTRKNH